MKNQIIKVKFESIEPEGKAVSHYNQRAVFCFGVLPNEVANIRIIKQKKNYYLCELVELLEKSEYRIKEKEDHYLSCSPWQIIKYDFQKELKKQNIIDVFYRFAKEKIILNDFFVDEKNIYSYRTKIEYSLYKDDDGFFFAFHKRGSARGLVKSSSGCVLSSEKANLAGKYILDELNKLNFERNVCKTLTLRESKSENKVIAILAVKKQNFPEINIDNNLLTGLIVGYSNPLSPTSQIHELLYTKGNTYLEEDISRYKIQYGYDCFFQNNIQLFEKCLDKIKEFIPKNIIITELYSGVGTIGIILSKDAKHIYAIESEKSSVEFANKNLEINNISNYTIYNNPAENDENLEKYIKESNVLILDPPRTGLHKNVVDTILKTDVEKIVYLSCNPITQARDFEMLKNKYKIIYCAGFDFYPNTPHVENLLILEKI